MKIEWKNFDEDCYKILDEWLSNSDKHNLCMENKSWKQTACDIDDCLRVMDNSQFKNIMGFADDVPVVAIMFGIEQIKVLNVYDLVVNPTLRGRGVATRVIKMLLNGDRSLKLEKPYQKVIASTLPDNKNMQNLFTKLEFSNLGFDGEYFVFEKEASFANEFERE